MTGLRILIVDDRAQVRQDLRTILTLASDIDVVGEAANGQEAVQLVEALQPQVVLMDLEMPVMDGYEATQQIKVHFPACRVIALTVYSDLASRQKAAQFGADNFIEKGALLNILLEAIFRQKEDKDEE